MFDQYITFISQHWILVSIFVIVLILFLINEFITRAAGIPKLSAQQATQLMNHEKAVVVDLRSPEEFSRGHITAAINIPYKALTDSLTKLDKYKSAPIIFSCNLGQQSSSAGLVLRKQGFEKVFCLAGGISNWRNENLPLVKK